MRIVASKINMVVFMWLMFYLGTCSADFNLNTSKNLLNDGINRTSFTYNKYLNINKIGRLKSNDSSQILNKSYSNHNGKSPKFLRRPPQRRPTNRQGIQEKQFVSLVPRRPGFLFRLNPASFIIPAIPTMIGMRKTFISSSKCYQYFVSGLGASLAWIASRHRPISITATDIGSPVTNVTISSTNTNMPTITSMLTNTNTQTAVNNDDDVIDSTSTNTNTITNTNDGNACTCNCANNVCNCTCGKKKK